MRGRGADVTSERRNGRTEVVRATSASTPSHLMRPFWTSILSNNITTAALTICVLWA